MKRGLAWKWDHLTVCGSCSVLGSVASLGLPHTEWLLTTEMRSLILEARGPRSWWFLFVNDLPVERQSYGERDTHTDLPPVGLLPKWLLWDDGVWPG